MVARAVAREPEEKIRQTNRLTREISRLDHWLGDAEARSEKLYDVRKMVIEQVAPVPLSVPVPPTWESVYASFRRWQEDGPRPRSGAQRGYPR